MIITASILESLIAKAPHARYGGIGQLKQSVKENLEWLLNTTQAKAFRTKTKEETERQQEDDPAKKWPEVYRSVAVYGLPEFSNLNPENEADCNYICEVLKNAIELFEPRLEQVKITLTGRKEGEGAQEKKTFKRTISFEIRALLKVEPRPEAVVFDAKPDSRYGRYEVKEP